MFAAKYQLKRVTVAILNCASFHSFCCLMNRKLKSYKQCFYRNNKMFCGINSYNTCSNAVFRYWHSPTIVLPLVYCPSQYKHPCTPYVRSSPLCSLEAKIQNLLSRSFVHDSHNIRAKFHWCWPSGLGALGFRNCWHCPADKRLTSCASHLKRDD